MIVQYLLDWLPGARVALLGLPPRGKSSHTQPSIFTAATNNVNQRLRLGLAAHFPPHACIRILLP